MADNNRKGFLEKLLGKDKADEVRTDARKAAKQLDKLGVARKEEIAAEMVEEQPLHAQLAKAILEAAGGDLTTLTPERLVEILAALLPSEEMAEEETEPEPAPPTEETSEDEEEEMVKALVKSLNQQSSFILKSTEDLGTVAGEVVTLSGAVKSLLGKIDKIIERQDALEKIVSQRPRQASHAAETVISPESEMAKQFVEQLEKENTTTELGFSVRKSTPNHK